MQILTIILCSISALGGFFLSEIDCKTKSSKVRISVNLLELFILIIFICSTFCSALLNKDTLQYKACSLIFNMFVAYLFGSCNYDLYRLFKHFKNN